MKLWAAALLASAALSAPAAAQNWNASYDRTEQQGHRIGNPEADISVIEFVSYTCPHCADFEREAEAELKYLYVHEGQATVEYRHMIRNPIDVAAALVTECGPGENFIGNHRAMLVTQDEWLGKARAASQGQQQRWTTGPISSRMRAIANDLDWYELMEPRGYSIAQLDACLSDEARAQELVTVANANAVEYGVQGTPSFVVNGELLDHVHNWPALREVLLTLREAPQEAPQ